MTFNQKPRNAYKHVNLEINNQSLQEVESCQFLGIMIDNKLNWKTHVNICPGKFQNLSGLYQKQKNTWIKRH